ncbi:MAG: hypothetical protein HPY58_06215 [Firmicutes bacterium]|nr:hypothetical protein [Bacillota bacterium]
MGKINFAEMFRQLQASGLPPDASHIGEFLRGMGVSPENPEAAKKLLEQAGLGEQEIQEKKNIISLINRMTAGLSGETRRQMSQVVEQTLQQLGCEELPQDLAEFLEHWKGPAE